MHLDSSACLIRPVLCTSLALFMIGTFVLVPASAFSMQQNNSPADSRSIGDYRRDVKSFMKLSKAEDSQKERNAIFNLCQLHSEIVSDSRFETNQQLQGMRAVIAKRLTTYTKDFRNSQLRESRELKKSLGRSGGSRESNQHDEDDQQDKGEEREETADSVPDNPNDLADEAATGSTSDSAEYDWIYDSYSSMGQITGGPNQLFVYAGGRFAPPWDHGEELVDLIVNTLDPTFWRRNGGPGSIHYFRPLRVIVLRAPMQAHERTSDLLNKLRAADGNDQVNVAGFGVGIGN